jgi:hypothetical protein
MKTNTQIFDVTNTNSVVDRLKNELIFPYVYAYSSNLGGNENVSILLSISKDKKETWANSIFENSNYMRFHIYNNGTVKLIAKHYNLPKVRQFAVKTINDLITRLNKN